MNNRLLICLCALLFGLPGCKKLSSLLHRPEPKKEIVAATPTPAPIVEATPTPPPAIDQRASAIALCYHRFEDKPRDSLAITPAAFEQQMQALKDGGFTVIPMQDFLAWRRGEKSIPEKSAIVSIDDGYRSGYEAAWPILQKFGYPFTMFIYTNYVKGGPKSGGQSMSWDELAEMRDAGVDIEAHSVSHQDLRAKHGKTEDQYIQWLREELISSKKMLESQLGIRVNVFAYPYGAYNEKVREVAKEAGYEACFTVYGQRLTHGGPSDVLGRYAIESTKPQIFQAALAMSGGGVSAPSSGGATMSTATAGNTEPADGSTIRDAQPLIKADLASFGQVDPASVQMRVSGLGPVPAKFDPKTRTVSFMPPQPLREKSYTVIVSAKAQNRKVETRWSFNFDPSAAPKATSVATP